MPNKRSFYESINVNSIFDTDFYKKVYGYSVCDKQFLDTVGTKLINMGRKDVIVAYNQWFAEWKREQELQLKKVAEWYLKESDRQFKEQISIQREEGLQECKQKKIELLKKKKTLLLMKKSMQLIKN